jgi:5'-nucleotidase
MIMKRLFLIISAFAVLLTASAQDLTILHLNDTHSHIDPQRSGKHMGNGGVIEQAAYVDSMRAACGAENVMLVHAGDFSQGTSYFTELGGDIEIDILKLRFVILAVRL